MVGTSWTYQWRHTRGPIVELQLKHRLVCLQRVQSVECTGMTITQNLALTQQVPTHENIRKPSRLHTQNSGTIPGSLIGSFVSEDLIHRPIISRRHKRNGWIFGQPVGKTQEHQPLELHCHHHWVTLGVSAYWLPRRPLTWAVRSSPQSKEKQRQCLACTIALVWSACSWPDCQIQFPQHTSSTAGGYHSVCMWHNCRNPETDTRLTICFGFWSFISSYGSRDDGPDQGTGRTWGRKAAPH